MTGQLPDPLDALREPPTRVQPDPRFAARLREQLERALLDTQPHTQPDTRPASDQGASPMSTMTEQPSTVTTLHTLTPYLAVADASAALEFYVAAFGARRRGEPIVMSDGRIGHAELQIGDSVLMLADEYAELGLLGPAARGGPSQSLRIEVADPDATVERAVAIGALLDRPVADSPYGRGGAVLDPFGHRWMVSAEPAEPVLRRGDVGYASLWTGDVEAAERFFGAVLGWQTTPGASPQGRHVTNLGDAFGMWGGRPEGTAFLCFVVPDVDRAVELVRAGGGTAEEPRDERYGRIADSVDDQGLNFAVLAPAADRQPSPDPARHGALSYVTIEVPDTVRARAFYALVLGWGFVPGRAPGGWHVLNADGTDLRPTTGLGAGTAGPTVVPMFTVADIATAVRAVRAAGGSVTEPVRQPYGTSAECTDDQGARFRLIEY